MRIASSRSRPPRCPVEGGRAASGGLERLAPDHVAESRPDGTGELDDDVDGGGALVVTFPAVHRAIVTAGFTWPPETCPTTETMIARTRPCASATPRRSREPLLAEDRRPGPTKTNANVATNSATAAFPRLSIVAPRSSCVRRAALRARPARRA